MRSDSQFALRCCPAAMDGKWLKGPGVELFEALEEVGVWGCYVYLYYVGTACAGSIFWSIGSQCRMCALCCIE